MQLFEAAVSEIPSLGHSGKCNDPLIAFLCAEVYGVVELFSALGVVSGSTGPFLKP